MRKSVGMNSLIAANSLFFLFKEEPIEQTGVGAENVCLFYFLLESTGGFY